MLDLAKVCDPFCFVSVIDVSPFVKGFPQTNLYTFVINFPPDLTILLAPSNSAPAEAVAPANAHTASHPLAFKMAPAIGVPVSPPIAMTAKPMPILVPMRPRLGDNSTKQAGGSETKVPEKKP